MAESSDSAPTLALSFQATDPSLLGMEERQEENKRFFALYSFSNKRLIITTEQATSDSSDSEDGSSSLSIAATNLSASAEAELRKVLSLKLIKLARPVGESNFFSVGLSVCDQGVSSASCYYCLLSSSSDSLGFDHVASPKSSLDGPPSDLQQFVVCFISLQDSSLDSFRSELDHYTKGVIPLLDKEPPLASESSDQLSKLSTGLQTYLDRWPSVVLCYLTRAIESLGSSIQQLIYAALMNASVEINGATSQQEEDIRKLLQCCNLPGLLEQSDSGDSSELWHVQPTVLTLTFSKGEAMPQWDKPYSCQFCKNAGEKLLTIETTNISKIRDFLESIKLAFAHNLNKLKRFLKQAELDYYAQYRALSYLKKCGCGDLLLRYVKVDIAPETASVLSVLETFITEMKQTLA